jgi:hypothetical protein
MTVVLPAPFGPSRPTTSPRSTVKDTSSTATCRRYRLRSPEHHTAGVGGSSSSSRTAAATAGPPGRAAGAVVAAGGEE